MDEKLQDLFDKAKRASQTLLHLTDTDRNRVLMRVADAVERNEQIILSANEKDLAPIMPAMGNGRFRPDLLARTDGRRVLCLSRD